MESSWNIAVEKYQRYSKVGTSPMIADFGGILEDFMYHNHDLAKFNNDE